MQTKLTTKGVKAITIAVTPNLKHAFDLGDIRGQGGFQSLMRSVTERITKSGGVARFDLEEFTRITKYATSYGEGGFQQRLRLLVSQWVAQNTKTLIGGV